MELSPQIKACISVRVLLAEYYIFFTECKSSL